MANPSGNILSTEDIVGKVISNVLQTPWETFDGTDACTCFVFLSGHCIHLDGPRDAFVQQPIIAVNVEQSTLMNVEAYVRKSIGQKVKDLVISYRFPSLGLLLETNEILCVCDYSPFKVGPMLLPLSRVDDQVLRYWGHEIVYDPL